jgi:hypothetical protein
MMALGYFRSWCSIDSFGARRMPVTQEMGQRPLRRFDDAKEHGPARLLSSHPSRCCGGDEARRLYCGPVRDKNAGSAGATDTWPENRQREHETCDLHAGTADFPDFTSARSALSLSCSKEGFIPNAPVRDKKEVMWAIAFLTSMVTVAVAAAVLSAAISGLATQTSAQAALRTPWGEPDLQGIWTEGFDTPLQRPARYANQEFFTEAQRQELDRRRAVYYGDDARQQRWSVLDDGVMYNTTFLTIKRAGPRTSMIVDPHNDACLRRRRSRPGIFPRAAAIDRRLQEQGAGVRWRQVRPDTIAAIFGTVAGLPRRQQWSPQPRRRTGGRRVAGPLPAQRAARVRQPIRRQLSPHRAGTGRHLDLLRREPGQGWQRNIVMNASPQPTDRHPTVVRRLARSLGGRHARARRHQLQSQDRRVWVSRKPAAGRALDAHRARAPRVRGLDRRSDRVDAAMGRQAGVRPTERPGEQDLLRAALHRGKLWSARLAARTTRGGARVRTRTRTRPQNQGQRRRRSIASAGSAAMNGLTAQVGWRPKRASPSASIERAAH